MTPFCSIESDQAQSLMDQLWQCGFRPTEGTGSAGAMAATERHLKDLLSCQDRVLRNVCDQIISGWTEFGSHGYTDVFTGPEPESPINKARRYLAANQSDIVKKEIEDLQYTIAYEREHNGKLEEQNHELSHRIIQYKDIIMRIEDENSRLRMALEMK